MAVIQNAEKLCADAQALVAEIKEATMLSITEARKLIPVIREAEGWLLGARQLLDPTFVDPMDRS